MGDRPVAKAMLAGLALALCGMALPYAMFAGETQSTLLMARWTAIPAGALVATGFVKAALTPACIKLGWRGGHFFPVIFSGIALGYGFAQISGADGRSRRRIHLWRFWPRLHQPYGGASAGHVLPAL